MDTTMYLQVPDQEVTDKYTASIELSNACRQFYKSRVEAANCIKTRWERHSQTHVSRRTNDNDIRSAGDSCNNTRTERKQRNSIDEAMEKLRTEMASLMDQDLSLMRQLLTLNETIEELKWQRRYYYSRRSLPDSSQELDASDCSVSDTEMYDSDDDRLLSNDTTTGTTTVTTVPKLSISSPCKSTHATISSSCKSAHSGNSSRRKHGVPEYGGELKLGGGYCSGVEGKRCVDTQVLVNGSTVKVYHGEQNSFDSGIHESSSEDDASV